MILAAVVIRTPGVQSDSERLCSSGKVIPAVLHNLSEMVRPWKWFGLQSSNGFSGGEPLLTDYTKLIHHF